MKKLRWIFRIFIIGNLFNGAIFIGYFLITKNSFLQSSMFLMIFSAIEFLIACLCLSNPSDGLSDGKRDLLKDSFINRNLRSKYISDSEDSNFIVFQIFSVFGLINILYLLIITKLL